MVNARQRSRAYREDPLGVFPWALSKLYTRWLRATHPFASIGRGVSIHYTAVVNRAMVHRIKLGNSVMIGKDVWLNIIPEATDDINIVIDDQCRLAARGLISAKNRIHLERDVHLGPSVLIQDHGHFYGRTDLPIKKQKPTEGGRIRIERGCQIGQGVAIVCDRGELVLGQHSVVIPNSVVLRSAPPYSLVGGNPARVIERLDSSQANQESSFWSTGEAISEASPLGYSPEASRPMAHHRKA